MRRILMVLLIYLSAAPSVSAGAWLRDKGKGFFSFGSTLRSYGDALQSENSLYGEYGLGPKLMLGFDINDIIGVGGHALVFFRTPIGPRDRALNMSLELALGAHRVNSQSGGLSGGMAKSTFSVGKGFSSRWGDGWFNIDTAVEYRDGLSDPAFKLDAIIGASSNRRFRPLVQVETTYIPGNPLIWAVVPGVMIRGKKNTTWVLGLERKTSARASLGLKFSIWKEF